MHNWKRQLNRLLVRTTGYQLTRAGRSRSSPAGDGARASSGEVPADARPTAPKGQARPTGPGGRKKRRKLPADYDDEARDIIRAVRPYTMTHHDKLYALVLATRYVVAKGVTGDIVECGVWRGGSMLAVARTLLSVGDSSRELYLFDTFEGMPPPSDVDVRYDGVPAATLMERSPEDGRTRAVASLDEVRANFEPVPYPKRRIHYVEGRVEDTVPARAPERMAILRLDTDWYESTYHELVHLYPRLETGGVLIIDDYGWFEGSREATERYFSEIGESPLLLRVASGRIAVKQ